MAKFETAMSSMDVFDRILSCLSPQSTIRFGRTCSVAYNASASFNKRAYNIDRHLNRFFDDTIAFRSMQARTGTIVSGSMALQFLDRTTYIDSDLDIYVHPGHLQEVGMWLVRSEGYTFQPKFDHIHDHPGIEDFSVFADLADDSFASPRIYNRDNGVRFRGAGNKKYFNPGIMVVCEFIKRDEVDAGESRKIDLILTHFNPLDSVLQFHSSKYRVHYHIYLTEIVI